MHVIRYELTNGGGNLYSHEEEGHIVGLSPVEIREIEDERFVSQMETVRRYEATSEHEFVVVIVSQHWQYSNGEREDLSEIKVIRSTEEEKRRRGETDEDLDR